MEDCCQAGLGWKDHWLDLVPGHVGGSQVGASLQVPFGGKGRVAELPQRLEFGDIKKYSRLVCVCANADICGIQKQSGHGSRACAERGTNG